MFPEHVERRFLDPEYSFVAVRRITRAKVRPIKNQIYSPNTPNYVREQMFAQLTIQILVGITYTSTYIAYASTNTAKNIRIEMELIDYLGRASILRCFHI